MPKIAKVFLHFSTEKPEKNISATPKFL